MGTFKVSSTAFAKCAPNISTNIRQCGTVTICNAKPVTADELNSLYLKSGDFRVMDALFKHDIEIRMCEAVQNGLYDFFMANKIVTNKGIQTRRTSPGVIEVAPFILARQYSPINNQYWKVTGGTASGTTYDWKVTVASITNIPIDVASFPSHVTNGTGIRVSIHGKSNAGSTTETLWEVATATDNGNGTATLELITKNLGSFLDPDKLSFPASGLLRRGTPNVNKFEKWCQEAPTYLNWKNVPFWVESTRHSMCWSSLYQQWKQLVLEGNMLYEEFFNLDETQKNKQLGKDWQDRFVYQLFWGKGEQYQDEVNYSKLQDITAFDGSAFGLGVDGGRCVGKRASIIGIYEQMAQCGRIADAQGAQLNLPALFQEMYNMMRVKQGSGRNNAMQFDVFTDSVTAFAINQAMLQYYTTQSNNTMRLNIQGDGYSTAKKADFGFYYRSYPLFWPQGVVMNVLWHEFFDDYISGAAAVGASIGDANFQNTARVLWVLDFAGIYPGIISTTRKVWDTGKLKELATISGSFACVMEVPTQQQTLMETVLTVIVECPKANLIIEGFNNQVPEPNNQNGVNYPGTHTSTTTTTGTPYPG
jgi:hypothetical protein